MNGEIFVEVYVEDQWIPLLIDTEASVSILSEKLVYEKCLNRRHVGLEMLTW